MAEQIETDLVAAKEGKDLLKLQKDIEQRRGEAAKIAKGFSPSNKRDAVSAIEDAANMRAIFAESEEELRRKLAALERQIARAKAQGRNASKLEGFRQVFLNALRHKGVVIGEEEESEE